MRMRSQRPNDFSCSARSFWPNSTRAQPPKLVSANCSPGWFPVSDVETPDEDVQPLGKIAELVMGQSPRGDTCNRDGDGHPLLNGPTEFGPRSPVVAQWTTDPKRWSKADDTLFCVHGSTTGRMNIADQPYAIGRGIAAIRGVDPDDTDFIRYSLVGEMDRLLSLATGSMFPNLSGKDLREFAIPWPPKPDRLAIACVIRALDDLINLKARLVGIADEGIREAGAFAVVQGCLDEALPLSEVASFTNGYSYRSSELVELSDRALVNLKNFGRNGGFRVDGLKPFDGTPKATQLLAVGDILQFAKTDLTQNAEVVGRCVRLPVIPAFRSFAASLDAIVVRPTGKVARGVLLALLSQPDFREHCAGYANGTTVLHMNNALPDYQLPALSDRVGGADRVGGGVRDHARSCAH